MQFGRFFGLTLTLFLTPFLLAQVDFGGGNQPGAEPGPFAASPVWSHSAPVNGTVQQFDGSPAKDVRVQLIDRFGGQTIKSDFTDAAGAFHMTEVPPGNYEIVAQSGLNEAREQVSVHGVDSEVSLRFGSTDPSADAGNRNSVSVAQIKVPEQARRLFRKAQELAQKNKPEDARKFLSEALQKYPTFADAITLQAILDMGDNQMANAAAELEQAIQYDPNYALAYIALGSCLNTQSHFEDAVRSLEQGLRLEPASWQAHFEMGKALTAKADFKKALDELAKAESGAPKFPAIHLVRGYALIGLGQYPNAISELEAYVQADPAAPTVSKAKLTLEKIRTLAARATTSVPANALR